MKLIPLSAWAERVHGEYAPHQRTLLRWVKAKRIQPAPVKIGRGYYVAPNAVYGDATPEESPKPTPEIELAETVEVRDENCPLYCRITSRVPGVYFGTYPHDFAPLTPNQWFAKNSHKMNFDRTAISVSRVPYTENSPPTGEGIYFLFSGDELGYVGQSKCIRTRLLQHAYPNGMEFPEQRWFDSYTAIWVPRHFLNGVERRYIRKFRPRRNLAHKPR